MEVFTEREHGPIVFVHLISPNFLSESLRK